MNHNTRRNLLALVVIAALYGAVTGTVAVFDGPRDMVVPTWAALSLAAGLAITKDNERRSCGARLRRD